jgi:hypothetical protein
LYPSNNIHAEEIKMGGMRRTGEDIKIPKGRGALSA